MLAATPSAAFWHEATTSAFTTTLSMGYHRGAVPADRLIVGDLAEAYRLDQVLVEYRIEAVVHFAAFALVGESVADPAKYYQNNLVNTLTSPRRAPATRHQTFCFQHAPCTALRRTALPVPIYRKKSQAGADLTRRHGGKLRR